MRFVKKIGVVIGRFQVPELTDGHIALLDHVIANSDDVCILVGVSPTVSVKNLLPFDCVEQTIRTSNPEIFHVHPLEDIPGEDLQWSMQIDRFLSLLFPRCEISLYGGRDSFKDHYVGRHRPVVEFNEFDTGTSGTRVRSEIIRGKPEDSAAFRRGIIFGVGRYVHSQLPATDGLVQSVPLEAATTKNDLNL